jgi:hypothetical protein
LTEVTLDTCAVADPGYTYKLQVEGVLDASSSRDGYCPIALVRLGSISGPVVAVGYGCLETYSAAVVEQFSTPGAFVYNIPVWAASLDVLLLGGGGGGSSGEGNPLLWGDGGYAASWSVVTLTVGSGALPPGVTQITGTIGSGGPPGRSGVVSHVGGAGTPTTATYYHTTQTSVGGAGGAGIEASQNGQNAGSTTASGYTYQNGGYGCGGRGGSGGILFGGVGTAGAGGLALIVAHPPGTDWNSGPINIFPLALADQDPLTGASTLYLDLLRMTGDNTSTGTVTASTFKPSLWAMPVPA